MNKLELEMKIQRLKFSKELCKSKVELDKNSLLMNRVVIVFAVLVMLFLTYASVNFFKRGMLLFGMFDMLLAIVNIILCNGTITRNKVLKRDLESGKAELERLNSEIQSLKVCHVNETEL